MYEIGDYVYAFFREEALETSERVSVVVLSGWAGGGGRERAEKGGGGRKGTGREGGRK